MSSSTYRERSHHLLTLSARTPSALNQAAVKLGQHVTYEPEQELGDLAFTLHQGRVAMDHRRFLLVSNREELLALCESACGAEEDLMSANGGTASGKRADRTPKIAFLFSGQGSQFSGMGRELYSSSSVVRTIFDECFELLRPHYPHPFSDYMFNPEHQADLNKIHISSVAMFMIEYALANLWISWGVRPQYVIGHSLGEYAAACLAGAFTLQDALLMVVKRGHLMQEDTEDGALLSVNGARELVEQYLLYFGSDVSIATVNGPEQFVIGGRRHAIEQLDKRLEQDGVVHRLLPISTASHSVLMEPILAPYRSFMDQHVAFHTVQIPLVSNLTGQIVQDTTLDADYWCRHLREPVQFASGIETLVSEGVTAFLEVGPHPVLKTLIDSLVLPGEPLSLASMNRKEEQWKTIQESLGYLWLHGTDIDWKAFDQDYNRRRVHAPTYPFEKKVCWSHVSDQAATYASIEHSSAGESLSGVQEPLHREGNATAATYSTEEWVRRIWHQVLGIEQFAPDDHIINLGAESLHMIQVQSRIRKALKVEVQLRELYQHPTFGALVELLNAKLGASSPTVNAKPQQAVVGQVRLSHIQQMWFDMPNVDPEYFFLPISLETDRALRPELLQQALQLLHEHHDMLRATYRITEDGAEQVLLAPHVVQVELEQKDLSGCPAEEREAEYAAYAEEIAQRLKFGNGLMNRAALVRWSEGTCRFLWVVTHLYSDTVTQQLLTSDLIETYQRLEQGQQAQLEKTASYRDWVEQCHAYINSPSAKDEQQFWEERMDQFAEIRIPLDCVQGSNTFADMFTRQIVLPEDMTTQLRALVTAADGVSMKEVLFTLVSRTLSRWLNREQIFFGINGHGREVPGSQLALDLSRTAGYFVNNYPLLTEVKNGEPFAATLQRVARDLQALPQNGASYQMLRHLSDDSQVRARFRSIEQPDILLNYHGEWKQSERDVSQWRTVDCGFLEQPLTSEFPTKVLLVSSIRNGCLHMSFNGSAELIQEARWESLEMLYRQEAERAVQANSALSVKGAR